MASLYKRANAAQRRILKIIEGAIKNASDAHPEQAVSARMARSIAKRATGTLWSQLDQTLAAQMPSERRGKVNL